jgi:hypothetical protein
MLQDELASLSQRMQEMCIEHEETVTSLESQLQDAIEEDAKKRDFLKRVKDEKEKMVHDATLREEELERMLRAKLSDALEQVCVSVYVSVCLSVYECMHKLDDGCFGAGVCVCVCVFMSVCMH